MVAKRAAERRYEEALADGLHTANLGNLKPGDELVLTVRFAQLLAFEKARLRLAMPTTNAPRDGNAAPAGLQPQKLQQASLLAAHPLALAVTVAGALAGGIVECRRHRFSRQAVDGGLQRGFVARRSLALDEAVARGLSIGDAWLMLAHWAKSRPAGMADAAVTAALQPHLDAIDASLFAHCMQLFDRMLGACESNSWALSRTRRLQPPSTSVSGSQRRDHITGLDSRPMPSISQTMVSPACR